MFFMHGVGSTPGFEVGTVPKVGGVGLEKTDENWSLRRLAFSMGLCRILLPEVRSAIPTLSVLLFLIYVQNFLLLFSSLTKFST